MNMFGKARDAKLLISEFFFNNLKLIFISVTISIFLFCASQLGFSQINQQQLADFAQRKSAEWQIQRAEAETIANSLGLLIRQVFADGTVIELQRFENGRPIYYITNNLNAAKTVSTDKVWPGGSSGLSLDGSGQTLGIWDGGNINAIHQELTGRVTNLNASGLSSHATHVAGTMIAEGVDANAKGMSFAGNLRGYDFSNDEAEMAAEQLLPNPIRVSNHSYGFITGWRYNYLGDLLWVWFGDVQMSTVEDNGFGFYGSNARDWDQIAFDSPGYLMVKSAGNDRNDAGPGAGVNHWHWDSSVGNWVLDDDFHPGDGAPNGYDSIGGGSGSAKNILTIGAVADIPGGYSQPSDVVQSSFSGWGPTDDGRIKPDLVGNGVSLYSPEESSNTDYGTKSGTSMSAPNVSGSVGLLNQHAMNLFGQYFKSSTMKALMIHTADEAGPDPGPDYMNGWGLLNTASAADLMTAHSQVNQPFFHINEIDLANGGTEEFEIESDGNEVLCATIAWTDSPGTPPANVVDPPDLMLVNDIDLRVIGPSGVNMPWVLDPANPANAATTGDNFRDNVEQVFIAAPTAGTYTVQITHKGTLASGSPQCVSLIVSGNSTSICPADINVSPSSLSFTVQTNGTDNTNLTISNVASAGCNNLDWSIGETEVATIDQTRVITESLRNNRSLSSNREPAGSRQILIKSEDALDDVKTTSGTATVALLPGYEHLAMSVPNLLYDNGPLVNSPGTGAGGADESVLQTNSLGMTTLGFGHQVFYSNRIADEFTVTELQEWTIDSLHFFAYQTGSTTSSTFTAVNYRIWDGPPGNPGSNIIFGDVTTNRLMNTKWSGIYRVTENSSGNTDRPIMVNTVSAGVNLGPGTYWLDWQTDGTLTSGPWAPPITINGQTTTGNGLQSLDGGTTWGIADDSGTGAEQGFPFSIYGEASGECSWLSEDPTSGTLTPGSNQNVDIMVDATGLLPDTYRCDLRVTSNDPDENPVIVPVTLNVIAFGLVFRVERSTGDVFADGSFIPNGADIAEKIKVSERVEPGDIVELDPTKPQHYRKARGNSNLVAGIVTTNPGMTLGTKINNHLSTPDSTSEGSSATLALMGRVPVKATTENGPIHPGDLVMVSNKPGFAMRCNDVKGCQGAIVGKALQSLKSGEGKILVLVMAH